MKGLSKEIKEALDELAAKLAGQGVSMKTRAFNIGEDGITPMSLEEDKIGDMLKNAGLKTQEEQQAEGPCFCPNCFNFETFEQTLGEGYYDYKVVTFGNGKKFDVKYYDGKHGEQLMMSPQEEEPQFSRAELQKQLEEAVRVKDYAKAQEVSEKLGKFVN